MTPRKLQTHPSKKSVFLSRKILWTLFKLNFYILLPCHFKIYKTGISFQNKSKNVFSYHPPADFKLKFIVFIHEINRNDRFCLTFTYCSHYSRTFVMTLFKIKNVPWWRSESARFFPLHAEGVTVMGHRRWPL